MISGIIQLSLKYYLHIGSKDKVPKFYFFVCEIRSFGVDLPQLKRRMKKGQ